MATHNRIPITEQYTPIVVCCHEHSHDAFGQVQLHTERKSKQTIASMRFGAFNGCMHTTYVCVVLHATQQP